MVLRVSVVHLRDVKEALAEAGRKPRNDVYGPFYNGPRTAIGVNGNLCSGKPLWESQTIRTAWVQDVRKKTHPGSGSWSHPYVTKFFLRAEQSNKFLLLDWAENHCPCYHFTPSLFEALYHRSAELRVEFLNQGEVVEFIREQYRSGMVDPRKLTWGYGMSSMGALDYSDSHLIELFEKSLRRADQLIQAMKEAASNALVDEQDAVAKPAAELFPKTGFGRFLQIWRYGGPLEPIYKPQQLAKAVS